MRDDEMPVRHPEKLLRELLSIVHRDGGHHATEHGLDESTRQAIVEVHRLIQAERESKATEYPDW